MRENKNDIKYEQVKEFLLPITKAKDYALRRLIDTGKKMGKYKYLMLAGIFIFLFIYHFSYRLLVQMRMREKLARAISMVLVVAMVLTSFDVTIFAAEKISEEEKQIQIIEIEALDEAILNQELLTGDAFEKISFPEALQVVLQVSEEEETTEPPMTEEETPEPPVTEEETSEPPVTEEETPEPPVIEEETPEPPVTEEETPEPPVTEEETSEPPAIEEESPEPPVTEEETTEPPVTEEETSEPSVTEEETTEPPVTEEETPEPPVTEEETTEPPIIEEETSEPPQEQPQIEEPEQIPEEVPIEMQNLEVEDEAAPVESDEADVENTDGLAAAIIDVLFPPLKVHAAELEAIDTDATQTTTEAVTTEETAELPITWTLDKEAGSGIEFSSEVAGAVFVYRAQISEGYALAEGVELPFITVTINEVAKSFEQSTTIDGITITVQADKGVFPSSAVLKVTRIADAALLEQYSEATEEQKENNAEKIDEDIYAFDITILDKEGKEIQPDTSKGEVTVSFSNPNPSKWESEDYDVYHMDESTGTAELLDSQITAGEDNVEVEVQSFSPFILRATSYAITLHTTGGTIQNNSFKKIATGVYVADSTVSALPTPTIKDSATTFKGWYTDAFYSTKVSDISEGGTFYAKWERTATTVNGSSMGYEYLNSGINAFGIDSSGTSKTTYANQGLAAYYIMNTSNPSGRGTKAYPALSGDIYKKISGDLYLAQVATMEGAFVCYSYYLWNKGNTDITGFNLAVTTDVLIKNNDYADLIVGTDDLGSYVIMQDSSSGDALKLYFSGDSIGVSNTSTFWTGHYSARYENMFNNNPVNQSGIDSAIAFSWQNITIPAGSVVAKTSLVGCGAPEKLIPNQIIMDTNGDGIKETITLKEGELFQVPEAPATKKEGYLFQEWNTKEDGSGTSYQPGDLISPDGTITLHAIYKAIESEAEITLHYDDAKWSGQEVKLYESGTDKEAYSLTLKTEGVYSNTKVLNGTYDIYVNGRKSDQTITIHAVDDSVKEEQLVEYYGIQVTTTLDDANSSKPGAVTLRKDSTVYYTPQGTDGVYEEYIQKSEGDYQIYVDGTDTGFAISADTDADKRSQQISFITAKVTISDDAAWTDAQVELRDSKGELAVRMQAGITEGNKVIYQGISQQDSLKELHIFVDNIDIHKTIKMAVDECTAEVTFYTAKVTVKGFSSVKGIQMTNGIDNYELTLTETSSETLGSTTQEVKIYTKEHVMKNDTSGSEIDYEVKVVGALETAPKRINSGNKELTYQFYSVEFYNIHETGGGYTPYLLRTLYILENEQIPPYSGNVKLSAYTFSHWSETSWAPPEEGSAGSNSMGAEFDFSTKVTKPIQLYANYVAPTVTIGELVYTDEQGNMGGNGNYYRLGNLTLSGFDPGAESIKYIYLTTTGTEQIVMKDTEGISVTNGTGTAGITTSGSVKTIVPTSDKIAIIFNSAVSMAEAQDFLRNQIVVKPEIGVAHTIIVEVTDKNGEFVAANAVAGKETTDNSIVLSGTNGTKTLTSGRYIVTADTTFDATQNSTYGESGLVIQAGATVYIYVAEGATLTAKGDAANGMTGAGAGIYLPSNSTLYILGEGKVVATGGNAASGGSGGNGSSGGLTSGTYNGYYYAKGGNSGNGGYGGGGAGAGIGGVGGSGGSGGSAKSGRETYMYADGSDNYANIRSRATGYTGEDGKSGTSGTTMGTLYLINTNVSATGGSAGSSGGSGGSYGSNKVIGTYDGKYWYLGYGAGGGGGGAGYAYNGSNGIGGGGRGGSGGGSGGSGGMLYDSDSGLSSSIYPSGAGGSGGAGAKYGTSGTGTRCGGDSSLIKGGYGGSYSSSATNGGKGTTYESGTVPTYTIIYKTPSETAEPIQSVSYQMGDVLSLTLPEYQDTDSNVQFLGWQVEVLQHKGTASEKINFTLGTRYPAGTPLSITKTSYGNITFTAVTETVSGVRADDDAGCTIEANAAAKVYYQYQVVIKNNDNIIDMGSVKIGQHTVSCGADGTYRLIVEEADAMSPLPILVNGQEAGTTSAFEEGISDTQINYRTMTVKVEGVEPSEVKLTGNEAPTLIDRGEDEQGGSIYSVQALDTGNLSEDAFSIHVDGEDTKKTVFWGNETIITYHTLTVEVVAKGISKDEIEKVELMDENGKTLAMNPADEAGVFTLTKLKDSTKTYTVYINGEKTDTTVDFSATKTENVSFNRYTTIVKTQLNGTPVDMGTVRLGGDTAFNGTKMVKIGTGTYQLITTENSAKALYADGFKVKDNVTPGTEHTIDYYTITYVRSAEAGNLPEDKTWYLSGSSVSILANSGLTNGGKTFGGWQIGSKVYQPGETFTITSTSTAQAVWNATDISGAVVSLNRNSFVYNAESQIPGVTVAMGGKTLVENRDYTLSYTNTNTAAGRGTSNTVNAGTVTITVTGINDYAKTATASYVIEKKTISVQNLVAIDREYDGTTKVQLDTSRAFLQGLEAGDEVTLVDNSVARTYSPTAREDKQVVVEGNAQLTGAAASNYEVEPLEPLKVTITAKPITEDMFTVSDVVYNGTAQTPEVTAKDMSGAENCISPADYEVTYSNNVHAGQATITIKTTTEDPYLLESGVSQLGNYSGEVTLHFTIKKAPLTITANTAQSIYAEEVTDVTNYYAETGTIYTEEDRENLNIKAYTTVKKGYDTGVYTGAVKISYNTANTDYDITTKAADYTITKAGELVVLANGYTGVYDGKSHNITVTPQPEYADDEIKIYYSLSELTAGVELTEAMRKAPELKNAGEYTVYYAAESKNYQAVYGSAKVTIGKAPLVVTAGTHTLTYGESLTKETLRSDGAAVSYTGFVEGDTAADSVTGTPVFTSEDYRQYEDVGTYSITPGGLSSTNYELRYEKGSLQVEPKDITFTWSTQNTFTYTGKAQGITVAVSGLVNEDAVTIALADNTATNAGTYIAKVTGIGGTDAGNYTYNAEDAAVVSKSWSITPAENSWTITPAIQDWTAAEGVTTPEPVGVAEFGTVTFTYASKPTDGAEPDYDSTKPTEAGTYLMMAAVEGTENYTGLTLDAPVEFTIKSAGETTTTIVYVKMQDISITYGEDIPELTVSYTTADGNGFAGTSTETPTYTTNYIKGDPVSGKVGTYQLIPAGVNFGAEYEVVYVPGTLTVEKKEITLAWPEQKEYLYAGKTICVEPTISGIINNDIVALTYTNHEGINVGTYHATAILPEDGNYKLSENGNTSEYTWKIIKAENEFITAPSLSDWYYGEAPAEPMGTAKFGTVTFKYQEVKEGILDWNIFNPATSQIPTQAGTYRLIAEVEAGDGYKSLESDKENADTFTIHPAEVSITALDATAVYKEALASPLTYTVTALKGRLSDADKEALEIALVTDADEKAAVGTYPIEVEYKANDNVTVSTINGAYTITAAVMTIAAQGAEVTYDGKAHTIPSVTVTAGTASVKDAEIYYSTEALDSNNYGTGFTELPEFTDAGAYTIYYYVMSPNYKPVSGSAVLTIHQKEVTVTPKNVQITFGEAGRNNGAVYAGFVGGDNAESLALAPVYSYTKQESEGVAYTPGSAVGTYAIRVSVTDTQNYHFVPGTGTLTVGKKALTEDMFELQEAEFVYDKTAKEATVKVASSITNLDTADYVVTYENNIHAGENTAKAIITATDAGNYSGRVEKTFTIKPAEVTVTAVAAESKYNQPIAELGYSITSGAMAEGDELSLKAVTSVRKGNAVGTYPGAVTVEYDTANTDYSVTAINADYTVTEASLSVETTGYRGTYDGKEHKAEVSVKTGELFKKATIYYSVDSSVDASNYATALTAMPAFTDAGTYTVYYYAVCDNYGAAAGSVQVSIEKAPLTVTVSNAELTYGDSAITVTNGFTEENLAVTGLVKGETAEEALDLATSQITFTTEYTENADVGSYPITVNGLSSENYDILIVPGSLNVAPKTITFTWAEALSFTYDGKEHRVTAEIAGKVTGDDVSVGSYEQNQAVAAGTYTAVVKSLTGTKAGNYIFEEQAESTSKQWTIGKAENEWTIQPSISDWTLGNTASVPIASAKYGQVSYSYGTSQTGDFQEAQPTTAGSYLLKAVVAETGNYAGLEAYVAFEIKEKAAGSTVTTVLITAPNASVIYGDAANMSGLQEVVTAKASDGTSVTLADVTTGTVTLQTDYEQGNNAGSYKIVPGGLTAKEGYELQYLTGTLTVSPKPVSLIWSGSEFTYDGTEKQVTASASGVLEGDSLVVTGYEYSTEEKIQNKAVEEGSYKAHAISFAGNNWRNYTITDGTAIHTWEIREGAKAVNSFTKEASIASWVYGETPSRPAAEAFYGEVKFLYSDSENGSYTATQPTAAGTYYMKAVVEEGDSYQSLTSGPIEFTIQKAPVSIVAADVSSPAGAPLGELIYTVGGNVASGDDLGITLSTTATSTSKVGEYPITVSHNANSNYEIRVQNGYYFITASNTKLTVTASDYLGAYDGNAHGITITVKDEKGKDITGETEIYYSTQKELTASDYGTGSKVCPMLTNAGQATVYYYIASDTYEAVTGSANIEITKKAVTVSANNAAITYGEAPVSAGVVYSGFVGKDSAESLELSPDYTINYAQYEKVGTYRMVPGGLSETGNYRYEYVAGNLTVALKKLTFVWTGTNYIFDGNAKRSYADAVGLENNDVIGFAYEENAAAGITASAVNSGNYTAKVTALTGEKAQNYYFESGEPTAVHNWSIARGANYFTNPLTMSSYTYGDTPAEPTANAKYGTVEYLYSDSLTGAYSETKPENAGTYYVKACVEETVNYSNLESSPVAFTIRKAAITIMADDIVGTQGADIKELTYSVSGTIAEQDKATLNITLSTEATADSPAGSYPITVTAGANPNYSITTKEGTYQIIAQDLDVTVEAANVPYDGKEHGLTVTVTGDDASQASVYYSESSLGTVEAVKAQGSSVSPVRVHAGTKEVYYYVVMDEQILLSGSKDVVINKKELTVKANDHTILMGQMPANNGVSYSGFAQGEDETALSGTLSYTYSYSVGQDAGSYLITPQGLYSLNYKIVYESGVLTVNPVQTKVTITGVSPQNATYDGESHPGYIGEPTIAGNGVELFEITYRVKDGETLSEAPVDAGEYTVTIAIPSDNMYYRGSVSIDFTITKKKVTVKPQSQAILAGELDESSFRPLPAVYSGFIGEVNKDNGAIETSPTITVSFPTGKDFDKAGTAVLKITDVGALKADAAKNYELQTGNDATLTLLEKKEPEGSTEEDSGASVLVGNGVVRTAVVTDGSGLPKVKLETNLSTDKAEKLLDENEKEEVENGKNALIFLVVSDADSAGNTQGMENIEAKAYTISADMKIGLYLDLMLFKQIGSDEPENITNTKGIKVNVSLRIPEPLVNKDTNITRTYTVIYEHEGVVKTIVPQVSGEYLKFDASEFSLYAIAYEDTEKSNEGDDDVPSDDDDKPSDGDGDKPSGGDGDKPSGGDDDEPSGGNNDASSEGQGGESNTPGNLSEKEDSAEPIGEVGEKQEDREPSKPGEGATLQPEEDEEKQPDNNADREDGTGTKEEESVMPDTAKGEIAEELPASDKRKLEEALDKVKELVSGIEAGPYVQIPEEDQNAADEHGNMTFTVNIPDEFKAEGRNFYLIAVDEAGNIVVLPNESIEEGVITVTGKADLSYQMIYEDGSSTLLDMIGEDGRIRLENGELLKAKTDCISHWILLLISLLGLVLTAFLRKKKTWFIFLPVIILGADILGIILGKCCWEWMITIVYAVVAYMLFFHRKGKKIETIK